jgi:hypothetical protein
LQSLVAGRAVVQVVAGADHQSTVQVARAVAALVRVKPRVQHLVDDPQAVFRDVLQVGNEQRAAARPVEQAFFLGLLRVASEQVAPGIVRRQFAVIHADQATLAAALLMHVARQVFTPAAFFTGDQNGQVVLGGLLGLAPQHLHHGAVADRLAAHRGRGRRRFAFPAAAVDGLADDGKQPGQGNRLLHEIVGTQAGRLDRGLQVAVPGHDDHRAVRHTPRRPFA